uniref:Period circadian protein homolog 2 n=1 Tax=Pelodiscus sinensis TaxID=13735 RepID=K7F2B9_PELSI
QLEIGENISQQPYSLKQQYKMSGYSALANDHTHIIAEETDIQVKPEQHPDTLQKAIEMNSGSSGNVISGNDMNENYSNSHDSHGNESSENGKEMAVLMESLDCHKSSSVFSLLIVDSEHNPSTSGCSSEQSTKAKTQKELRKTLQELKARLPPEKRIKGKSCVLATLKYALKSIKQVKANEEYYQLLMINESHPSGLDVSSYTVEEVENITSEYIMKNADMFAVAVSLITGKILYISDQAASILRCKRDFFKKAKFVEFLAPQDVSVFYSSTTPYKLPSWSICNGVETSTQDCMEEKSFFCRISISAGKEHEYFICYHPFRMTPYLIRIQDTENAEDQLCCVLLAEKVHSGYEAPRIPPDKRIFTTTHTPNCLFQDIDERAVPLLGYLPQDLIGTPILLHLHPSDRPLMLAIHKKILQYGGQPFDYSPIRFCTRNGEYITMDTSWSSFINPWSRKVSFIIGRHKVRTGPLNEDVFAAPNYTEDKILHPSIQEITEQIYRLLLQPVHNSGSSGYGSLGSNGSHEHLMSVASSSDSNGNNNEEAQKEKHVTCHDAHMVRNEIQHIYTNRRVKLEHKKKAFGEKKNCPSVWIEDTTEKDTSAIAAHKDVVPEKLAWKEQPVYSYQQISCLDGVIRYLESCSLPGTLKRKCEPSSNAASLDSNDHKQKTADNSIKSSADPAVLKTSDKSNGPPVVGAHLTSLALPGKPESVVSFTSQCSYSSTIVHVGDKKPQPELEIIEDGPSGTELLDSHLLVPLSRTTHANQEKEPFKKLGLTKEILAVHTQKEEQSFLNKFKEIKRFNIFQSRCNYYLRDRPRGRPGKHGTRGQRNGIFGVDHSWRKSGKNRKSKSKRIKPKESSDSTTSETNPSHRFPLQGLNSTAWSSPSDTSQASHSAMSFPAVMPAYPLPVFSTVPPDPEACLSGFSDLPDSGNNCPLQLSQFSAPLLTPVVAVVLPNYMYTQLNNDLPQTLYNCQPNFSADPAFSSQTMLSAQPTLAAPNPFPQPTFFPAQPFHYKIPAESEKAPAMESQNDASHSSMPQFLGPQDQASPPLFQSRCSSPLQLNLLQLEETPKSAGSGNVAGGHRATIEVGATGKSITDDSSRKGSSPIDSPMEAQNSDALSMSSDILDILLQEDACSGTGSASSGSGVSAAAESLGSGSNGCVMSESRTGSSETSHTSKYFGSIDSSENNHHMKKNAEVGNSEHFIKYVLQDPIWLLMANTDDAVMMTYQIPSRNVEVVLKEDKQKLKQIQKLQPKFTEEQKKELIEVHPWIQKGGLPKAIANSECIYCEENTRNSFYIPYEEEVHEMELNEMIEASEENNLAILKIGEEQT